MNPLEKSIISSTLINTIFQEYDCGQLNSSGEVVRKKIAKYMRQRSKTNRQLFIDSVMKCDSAWRETINHFAKQKLKIEAKTTIAAIYNYFSDELVKYVNLKDKHIEKLMICAVSDAEAEHNSDLVIDYLIQQLGLEKRKSAFAGKKLTILNNMIIDRKQVKEEFLK